MMRLFAAVVSLLAVAGAQLACSGAGEPVGSVRVAPEQLRVGYPGFAEAIFEWSFDRPLGEVEGNPRVFVHLVDELGRMARTFDHDLPSDWREGQGDAYAVKIYQSALAPPLTAGEYRLVVGLYDRSNRRWPLETDGDQVGDLGYQVATVSVAETTDGAPMFLFSSSWRPVEGGTDRQVLGRRWLGESGELGVTEISRPGTLWLLVGIPSGRNKVEDLVLDEGASAPSVVITSSCGSEFSASLQGSGSHGVEIPVATAGDGSLPTECEIRFDTNFYLVSLETLARRTIALENLAWAAS